MLAAAVLAVVLLIPHVPLLRGEAGPIWDAFDFFAPYHMLTGDLAREGRWLLWNPYVKGGSPDHLEPQTGAFSPLLLLFAVAGGGSRHTFELYWLVVWFAGPAGLLVLARHLGAPVWGGLAAALGVAFSFYTGNAEHTSMLNSLSALPWMLWRLDVALRDRTIRPAAEAGAIWGLAGLAGNPPFLLVNFCFAALWAAGRLLPDALRAPSHLLPDLVRAAASLAIAGAIGVIVMLPTYVGFFVDGPGYTHRTGVLSREVAVDSDALHPRSLVTLASPSLARSDIYEYTDISMRSLYMGCLIPVLALMALTIRGERLALRWWLFALALVFLMISLGRVFPLRGWLYDWFPPTRYFRHPALFRCYFILALALLSLFGARELQPMLQRHAKHGWRRFAILGTCVGAAALAVYMTALRVLPVGPEAAAHAHTWGLWLSLSVIAAIGYGLNAPSRARLAPMALVAVAIVDAVSTGRIASMFMYNQGGFALPGYTVGNWGSVDLLHRADTNLTPMGLERRAQNGGNLTMVMKIPALGGYGPLTGPLLDRTIADPVLSAAALGADRIWFSPTAPRVERSDSCFEAFRARAQALGTPPLVIHDDGRGRASVESTAGLPPIASCGDALAALPPARRLGRADVRVVTYQHERLTLTVRASEPGWLLVTDAWARAWTARVNDVETAVLPGNFVWRAVRVPAGEVTVDFEYRPTGIPWLIALSWGTLAVVGIGSVRAARRPAAPQPAIN